MWLNNVYDMTHSYMWHDAVMYVKRLIHIHDMTHGCMWHDSFAYAYHDSWTHDSLMYGIPVHGMIRWYSREMTHSYIWHDSCTYVTWLIHIYGMNHRYARDHLFIWHDMTHSYNMARPMNVRDMTLYTYALTHWCLWQDSFVFVMWLMKVCDMTYS